MRVLKGMEVQVILNDVAGIMDLPFPDNQPVESPAEVPISNEEQVGKKVETWSDPISPTSSSTEIVSDDNGSDDLFSWPNELKLALNNVKNNLTAAVNNTSASVSHGITVSGGRKRKMWEDTDCPASKLAASYPQDKQQQQLSVVGDQQIVISEPLVVGDCSTGSGAKLMTTLPRFKDNRDPLSGISAPPVAGTDQHSDTVKSGESGKDNSFIYSRQLLLVIIYLWPATYMYFYTMQHNYSSSSSFPVLGLLRPVMGVTKLNPSIFSKVCLNFFSLLVGILEAFLDPVRTKFFLSGFHFVTP
jgi:hypothetical protein